jgi:hypothetical protein
MTDSYIRNDDGAVMVAFAPHNYVSLRCHRNPKNDPPRCRAPETCMASRKCRGIELAEHDDQ